MAESRDAVQPDATECVKRELAAARALLAAQQEVEAALKNGLAGEPLLALVRVQENVAREAAAAARARAVHFPGSGSLEERLCHASPIQSAELRALAEEGLRLRELIRRSARRAEFVARRSLEWSHGQMELIVRCVTRDTATYAGPGVRTAARRVPSLMDRTA
jgi:hypothetical protein